MNHEHRRQKDFTRFALPLLTALLLAGCAKPLALLNHTFKQEPVRQVKAPQSTPATSTQQASTSEKSTTQPTSASNTLQHATAPTPANPILQELSPADIHAARQQALAHIRLSWPTIAKRSTYVRARILATLDELHAPASLQLLPAIESTYDPYAISATGARGLWQLMPRTAHSLGISENASIDGLRHIEQSTRAAVRYLQRLHQHFHSWPLAIAAYNLGPNAVARRLQAHPWQPQDGLDALPIPSPTRCYVQHFVGLTALIDDGTLTLPEPIATATVTLPAPIDLVRLNQLAGLSENAIFRFNPALNRAQYLHQPLTIHLPRRSEAELATIVQRAAPQFVRVTVHAGDSLWGIARRHNTHITTLKQLNPTLGSYLHVGQSLKVPADDLAAAQGTINPLLTTKRRIRYTVRSGDSLWRIAHRFGTTPKAIARINNIKMNHPIRAGDTLWVFKKVRPS